MNAKLTGVIVGAMLAGLGLGLVTPPRAQANETGKVLLGIAAGALLYGLIDSARDDDRRCDRNRGYVYSYGGGCYTDRDDWRWRHRDRDRWGGRDRDRWRDCDGQRDRDRDRWNNWDSGRRGGGDRWDRR